MIRMRTADFCRSALATATIWVCLAEYARADVAGYDLTESMVPMRDGVKLHTVIYRPKKQDMPLPIVLMRTPYGVDQGAPRSLEEYLKDMADDGYIFAFQDIRGRYRSEGSFVMNRPPRRMTEPKAIDEGTDAFDTIEWLVKNQRDNNGRVGMLGISYPGWLTVMALLEPHPALKAASPQARRPTCSWATISTTTAHSG